MGSRSIKSNPTRSRKRVEATATAEDSTLVRGKDGSAFARCEGCQKDVAVALISFHNCSHDAKIRMKLEAQVVEKPSQGTNKSSVERKKSSTATASEPKAKRAKTDKQKKSKDPNAPKRPLTAFFIFLADFRKTFKEANPDSKSVKMVAKEGGEKWKLMTDEEKKPYVDKAAELKAENQKTLETETETDDAEDGDGEAEDVSEKKVQDKEVEEVSEHEVDEVLEEEMPEKEVE